MSKNLSSIHKMFQQNYLFSSKPIVSESLGQALYKKLNIIENQIINKLEGHFMSASSFKKNEIRRSLRSINNCFRIPNMFQNKNEDLLTKNIEFIPKHVRRKIIDKQFLNCNDILESEFKPQRPKVDVFTVKTAVKIQNSYQNILFQRDLKAKQKNQEESQLKSHPKQLKTEVKVQEKELQCFREPDEIVEQCMKHEIPTEREIKKQNLE